MTDAYRNEAIDLDRYKSEMNQLSVRRIALEKQQEESRKRQRQEESRKSALEHLERFCDEVANGLDVLSFEEKQKLLRLVVERTVVKDNRVRIETVIPTDKQHAGLLRTRDPELDSGSRKNRPNPTTQQTQPTTNHCHPELHPEFVEWIIFRINRPQPPTPTRDPTRSLHFAPRSLSRWRSGGGKSNT